MLNFENKKQNGYQKGPKSLNIKVLILVKTITEKDVNHHHICSNDNLACMHDLI